MTDAERIAELEAKVRYMRSRVEVHDSPFMAGMEIRTIITHFDLVEARDPHALIDYVIDKARHDLHKAAQNVVSTGHVE